MKHVGYDWEVMQFTGLRDKNDVDIYEDDIVEVRDRFETSKAEGFVSRVDFIDGGFVVYPNDGWQDNAALRAYVNYWDVTVIGNFWENPELLEETP